MGRNDVQVCATCTQNCLLFHGTSKPSPTSFFKVMADDDYFRVLYIPPKFSSTVSPLVNKKIILKDSSGQQWNVTVSNDDGSFAFGEGWNVFSVDHGLKIGYFLVFNYINELHFDVKIYDNSGCERLDFSTKRNQKKRSRDKSGSPVSDGVFVRQDPNSSIFSKQDVPKMKRQHREDDDIGGTRNNMENISKYDGNNGRAQSVRISEHFEDPSHMRNREFEDKKRDDHTCGVDGTVKITTGSHVVNGSHIYQNDATKCNNKDPIFEGVFGTGCTSDASEFEISGAKGEISKKIKKELVTPDVYNNKDELGATGLPKVIKEECDNDSPFKSVDAFCCVVPDDSDFLKLPVRLPLSPRGRVEVDGMKVFLRDPLSRVWPVIYHEQPLIQILTKGWLDFCKGNNIQPEDVCIFGVENEFDHIVAVHIVHK